MKQKILYANKYFYDYGFTDEQRLWMLAMIDHESAGSWSPTIVGDNGCSVGISQYNTCAGNFPDPTYEGQVKQFADRMNKYFSESPFLTAISRHNLPYGAYQADYVAKVKATVDIFYQAN